MLLDTPGIHKPRTLLGERTNQRAPSRRSAEVDVVCLLVEANAPIGARRPVRRRPRARRSTRRRVLVVNKVDVADARRRSPSTSRRPPAELGEFDALRARCSARTGEGVDALVGGARGAAARGAALLPGRRGHRPARDVPRRRAAPGAAARVARDELPHSIAVTAEEIEDDATTADRTTDPARSGSVGPRRARLAEGDRDRQGRRGAEGGRRPRPATELEALLGTRVYLETRVRVEPRLAAPRPRPRPARLLRSGQKPRARVAAAQKRRG